MIVSVKDKKSKNGFQYHFDQSFCRRGGIACEERLGEQSFAKLQEFNEKVKFMKKVTLHEERLFYGCGGRKTRVDRVGRGKWVD